MSASRLEENEQKQDSYEIPAQIHADGSMDPVDLHTERNIVRTLINAPVSSSSWKPVHL